MTIAEIVILIVGALLFTVSFFIPDKGGEEGAPVSKATEEKVVKEMVQKEIEKFRFDLEEAAEESVNDNRDKMERAMDRITNEKMMAINEYSDNVLEKIHKNHEEAMFLYDMLNNKQTQVKATAAELNQIEKSVRNIKSEQVASAAEAKAEAESAPKKSGFFGRKESSKRPDSETTNSNDAAKPVSFTPINAPKVEIPSEETVNLAQETRTAESAQYVATDNSVSMETKAEANEDGAKKTNKSKPAKKQEAKAPVASATPAADSIELMFASDGDSNKDRIIALHDAGKSNMAIAKELGLGIGEVKLVLDLYQA